MTTQKTAKLCVYVKHLQKESTRTDRFGSGLINSRPVQIVVQESKACAAFSQRS